MIFVPPLAQLETLLENFYGISQVVWGAELGGFSSHNTAFSAGGKDFVLKRRGAAAQAEVGRIEELLALLQQHHFPAPIALRNRQGNFHFLVGDVCCAVFLRSSGLSLHQHTLGLNGLENTAACLARLHTLGPVAAPWLRDVSPGYDARHIGALQSSIPTAALALEDRHLIDESLSIKAQVLDHLSCGLPAPAKPGIHFVHGDFHNENILYDEQQRPTCVLDYEESHMGHGRVDAINFVQFACFHDGYGDEQLARGRHFLRAYREAIKFTYIDAEFGWQCFFGRVASSSFFERRVIQGDGFAATLLRRDIQKLGAYLQDGTTTLRSLVL